MNRDVDVNAIVAQFLAIKVDALTERLASRVRTKRAQEQARLRKAYRDYLTGILERYSVTKSFFHREEAVPLYSFYIPLSVTTSMEGKLQSPGLTDILSQSHHTILTGTAGSGKSMFMRHLLINSVQDSIAVPVFIQLRELDSADDSLVAGIVTTLEAHGAPCHREQLKAALDEGMLVLLLDGFDEAETANQRNLGGQIAALCESHPKTPVVVSSRPDSQFGGWLDFKIASLNGLSLHEACDLATRLPIADDLRGRLVKDLENGLFAKHQEFLSNPLLLSMMVLTYGEYAEVPAKLATFYSQAYETLFQRHDALKRGYKRERETRLDMYAFARVFSAFSLRAYDCRQTHFTRMSALEWIVESAQDVQVDVDPEGYVNDCLRAVCLLLDDGQEVVFTHRSFQEYFAALYIANAHPEVQRALIQKYRTNANDDDMFRLLYEHRPEVLDEWYVVPLLESFRREVGVDEGSDIDLAAYARYLNAIRLQEVVANKDGTGGLTYSGDSSLRDLVDELSVFLVRVVWPRLGARYPRIKWDTLYYHACRSGIAESDRQTVTIQIPGLVADSPAMRLVFDHGGSTIGGVFLKRLLTTEEMLRDRVKKSQAALSRILDRRVVH